MNLKDRYDKDLIEFGDEEAFGCLECGEDTVDLYPDMREPPLSTDECLCGSCHDMAIRVRVEELQGDIRTLRGHLLLATPEETDA